MTRAEVVGLLVGQAGPGLVQQHDARPADDGPRPPPRAGAGRAEHADLLVGMPLEPYEVEGVEHLGAPADRPPATGCSCTSSTFS